MDSPHGETAEVQGHRGKYARVERERRFLIRALPPDRAIRVRRIVDRYFVGTRLRLRLMEDVEPGRTARVYKLTQKIPTPSRPDQGLITNIYLADSEYQLFSGLPATVLKKTRHSIPPMGIDVFEGPLTGLITAEAEFATDTDEWSFVPPPYAVAEVSSDHRFTGGRLVSATRSELTQWLAEYGIALSVTPPERP